MPKQVNFKAYPTVILGHLTKQCSFWESPPFTYTHMPAVLGSANLRAADQGRVLFYPDLGIIMPAWLPVVWNQNGATTGGRPGLTLQATPSGGVTTDGTRLAGDRRFRTRYIVQSARVDDADDWAQANVTWEVQSFPQCNTVSFHLNVRGAAADETDDARVRCEWLVGERWFRADFYLCGGAVLQISRDAGVSWDHFADLYGGGDWEGRQDHTVDVTLIRDRLEIVVDGTMNRVTIPARDLDPYAEEEAPAPAETIADARAAAVGFVSAQAGIHPRGYIADAVTVRSAEINTGVTALNLRPGDISWQVILHDGTVASPSVVEATTAAGYPTENGLIAYDLTFKAPGTPDGTWYGKDYQLRPPMVRYVKLQIKGKRLVVGTTDTVPVEGIKRVTVRKSFNPATLNLYTQAMVWVNNYHGQWTDGRQYDAPWGVRETAHRTQGQRWGKLDMTVEAYDEDDQRICYPPGYPKAGQPWEDYGVRAWGVAGQQKGDALGAEFMAWFSIADLSAVMRDQQLFFVPWLDGWCHYAAIRQALSWGGLDPDAHTWVGDPEAEPGAIPACDDPFCTNAAHYHLPMGDGGHPLMQVASSASPWDVVQMVQSKTSHLAFFDKEGKLIYAPWDSLRNPSWTKYDLLPFAVHFNRHPASEPWTLASRVQNLSAATDQTTALNELAVVGLDAYGPRWFPVVARRELPAGWGQPQDPRFKGYRARGAVMDSKFASLPAAQAFADRLFEYSQWPDESLVFTTMAGPSLEPLVRVIAYDANERGMYRTSAAGKRYRIMATTEQWDWQSRIYNMTVECINIR